MFTEAQISPVLFARSFPSKFWMELLLWYGLVMTSWFAGHPYVSFDVLQEMLLLVALKPKQLFAYILFRPHIRIYVFNVSSSNKNWALCKIILPHKISGRYPTCCVTATWFIHNWEL